MSFIITLILFYLFLCLIGWILHINKIESLDFYFDEGILTIIITKLIKDKITGFTNTIVYTKEIILWQK